MNINVLLQIKVKGLSAAAIAKALGFPGDKDKPAVLALLKQYSPKSLIERRDVWQIECADESNIDRAMAKVLSRLPENFGQSVRDLPRSSVILSIAVLCPQESAAVKLSVRSLRALAKISIPVRIVFFSQRELVRWQS